MALYTDDFNRADAGTLGGSWVQYTGSFGVVLNQAQSSGSGDVWWYFNQTVGANQFSRATYRLSTASYPALVVRGDASSRYALYINPNGAGWDLQEFPGATGILSGADTIADGDIVELRAVGSLLSVWRNSSTLGSVTDATLATGTIGIGGFVTSPPAIWDDWVGGDYPIVSAATPRLMLLGVG